MVRTAVNAVTGGGRHRIANRRDLGVTLNEILISIAIIGVVVTAVSAMLIQSEGLKDATRFQGIAREAAGDSVPRWSGQ
jgi:prepilin-type N-terminal cleavage/methylation domain-containing protein